MIKHYNVTVNGTVYEVEVEETDGAAVSGTKPAAPAEKPAAAKPAAVKPGAGTPVNAPMQGTVLKVAVTIGAEVKKGDLICLLEAMKMENEIFSPCDGKVTSVAVTAGQSVATGALIATVG